MIEVLIGFVSGIVSGTGMGGGTILILCLTLMIGIDQHVAQATNLVFFIPTSIAAILVNIKQKYIDYKVALPIALLGMIGAVIGAKISVGMEVKVLKKSFGIFLAIIAIHEVYCVIKEYRKNKKRHNK